MQVHITEINVSGAIVIESLPYIIHDDVRTELSFVSRLDWGEDGKCIIGEW
jgi:hypothetical protein